MDSGFLGLFVFIFATVVLGILIPVIVGLWKIFEKAGEPGWASIVPIYANIVLLRIAGKPWWWLFLMFIPYIGIIWSVWSINMLSKSFGKESGYTVGLIFLPFIFFPMLGFGDAKYLGPYGDPVLFAKMQNEHSGFDFENDILDRK